MFGDGGPRRGGQQGGAGGEVERARLVAAGAAGVHGVEVFGEVHLERVAAHHPGGGGDLADRLPFGPQGDQEARRGRRAQGAGQKRLHHPLDLLRVKLFPAKQALQRLPNQVPAHRPSKKLPSRIMPPSVRMLSGWNCTPCAGRLLWRRPMIRPSSVQAVTSRQSGRLARSTMSEW